MVILCVDDDEEDLEIFCDAVKTVDPNITCLIAHSGDEAIRILKSKVYELPSYIFLDINMPTVDGFQCLNKIRENPKFDQINVYMYSTSTDPKDYVRARELNAKFLPKPVKYQTLIDSLDNIIKVYKV